MFLSASGELTDRRCWFSAFVGAGISVGSAIPAAGQFLPSCIAFCLDKSLQGEWNSQDDNWPACSKCDAGFRDKFDGKWMLGAGKDTPKALRSLLPQAIGAV
jgi:hypothetical protein